VAVVPVVLVVLLVVVAVVIVVDDVSVIVVDIVSVDIVLVVMLVSVATVVPVSVVTAVSVAVVASFLQAVPKAAIATMVSRTRMVFFISFPLFLSVFNYKRCQDFASSECPAHLLRISTISSREKQRECHSRPLHDDFSGYRSCCW
jgi:hypothetical protein